MSITETKLRWMLADHGLSVHSLRSGRHWVLRVSKPGGPVFGLTVSRSPSSRHFDQKFASDIRRRDREARGGGIR
jgi:hypothetical protein